MTKGLQCIIGWFQTRSAIWKFSFLFHFFFHIFIYTAKVVTNTVHNSTYIHLLTICHVTEFTFIACMQMLNVTLLTYNTLCYLLVNITYTTLTAYITLHYITRYYITKHYITCLHASLTIHDITLQYVALLTYCMLLLFRPCKFKLWLLTLINILFVWYRSYVTFNFNFAIYKI